MILVSTQMTLRNPPALRQSETLYFGGSFFFLDRKSLSSEISNVIRNILLLLFFLKNKAWDLDSLITSFSPF